MPAQHDDLIYRRGLVLGLTMAELMLLLLFVLLLTLATLFEHQGEELKSAREEARSKDREIAALEERLKEIEAALPPGRPPSEAFRELVLAKKRVQALEKRVAELEARRDTLSDQVETLTAEVQSYRELQASLEAANTSLTPKETAARLAEATQLREALKSANLPTAPQPLTKELAGIRKINAELDALGTDADRLVDQIAYLKRRAGLRGVEKVPCWITPDPPKRPAYIFDIVLSADGFVIHDRALPAFADEKAKLPLSVITFAKPLPTPAFRRATRPLYRWSVEKDCRFFVRVFDRTGPDQKALYKRRLRTVEAYFYKYEVQDTSVEPGSVDL